MPLYYTDSHKSVVLASILTDDTDKVRELLSTSHVGRISFGEVEEFFFDAGSDIVWTGEPRPKIHTSKCFIQIPVSMITNMISQLTIIRSEKDCVGYRTATSYGSRGKTIKWILTERYAMEIVDKLTLTIPNYMNVYTKHRQGLVAVKRLRPELSMFTAELPEVN